jgi:LacI family transcriptional regulator
MYHGVTLKTIADKAGCSVNTVSLALKNSPRISMTTQQKIRQIADELHYVPHNCARQLVTKRSNTIGLILRDISSQILSAQARRIEQYLEQMGYILCIVTTKDDPDKESNAIDLLISNGVDGLIINTSLSQNIPKLEALRKAGFPIVLVSYPYEENRPIHLDCIYPDLTQGAYLATRHLLNMGHSNILFVSNPLLHQSRDHKFAGYCKALKEYGVELRQDLIYRLPYYDMHISSDTILDDLLPRINAADAMLVNRDEDAIPILKLLDTNHIRIPEQIAIISIDNIPFAESAVIALSSVGYNYQRISYQAVSLLVSLLNGEVLNQFKNTPIEPTLYIRDSCGYRKN